MIKNLISFTIIILSLITFAGCGEFTLAPVDSNAGGEGLFKNSEEGFNDKMEITLTNVPKLKEGYNYEAWLVNTDSGTNLSLGVFNTGDNGTGTLSFTSEAGENLVGLYNKFMVTLETSPDPDPNPSYVIFYQYTLPSNPLAYIRHILYSWIESPNNMALGIGLLTQIKSAIVEANLALDSATKGDINEAKRYAEHVVNIIEGEDGPHYGDSNKDGIIENLGDGYGILPGTADKNGDGKVYIGYSIGTYNQSSKAKTAGDATTAMKTYASRVMICVENIIGPKTDWDNASAKYLSINYNAPDNNNGYLVKALAWIRKIFLTQDPIEAKGYAQKALDNLNISLDGLDIDKNGKIEPIQGEGTAKVAFSEAQKMATYYPVKATSPEGEVTYNPVTLTYTLKNLPTLPKSFTYEGWLMNVTNGQYLSTGKFNTNPDGTYTGSVQTTTFPYNQFAITIEAEPDSQPESSEIIVLLGTFPTQ